MTWSADVTSTAIQFIASAAALLALMAAMFVIVLHLVPTDVDPLVDGVSAYALSPFGYLYRIQVVATGLAALLLAVALLASELTPGFGVAALALFGASRILIARYPTDPGGTTSFSHPGRLHVVLAAITFVTIAVAAPSITGPLAVSPSWPGPATGLTALAWTTTIFALGTFATSTTPRTKRVFGLVERVAYGGMLAWLVVAAAGLSGLT
jgi:hypothetical protein